MNKYINNLSKILIVFLLSIFLFGNLFITTFAFGPSSNNIYQGIDVSSWQGNIDFRAVKNSGIDIVYIKSSEGSSYIDPYFEQNSTNVSLPLPPVPFITIICFSIIPLQILY